MKTQYRESQRRSLKAVILNMSGEHVGGQEMRRRGMGRGEKRYQHLINVAEVQNSKLGMTKSETGEQDNDHH